MKVGLGLLQDEFALTGEFQIFQGWAAKARASSLETRLFSPAGEGLRGDGLVRHETGESLLKTFREQWQFIDRAAVLAADVDALHLFLPTPNFLWIADRAKRRARKPVVVTCLGEKAEIRRLGGVRTLAGGFRFHLIRLAAAKVLSEGRFLCDRYVAGTESVAEQLQRSGCPGERVTVRLPFLPPESEADERSIRAAESIDPSRTFLYLGHFLASKGVDVLLKAFAALNDPESRLVLAWSGIGDRGAVERSLAGLGIAERTSILDFPVHRTTVMNRALALVLPYPVSYGQTSPPMALLEAFRAGVPVIVSGLAPMPALGAEGETMHRVAPGDWRGLSSKLRELRSDGASAEAMRRAQRPRYEESCGSADLRAFYEEVVAHGR